MLGIYKWGSWRFLCLSISLLAYQGNEYTVKFMLKRKVMLHCTEKATLETESSGKNSERVQLKMGFHTDFVTTIFYVFTTFPGEGVTNTTVYLRKKLSIHSMSVHNYSGCVFWTGAWLALYQGTRESVRWDDSYFFLLTTSCGINCKERASLNGPKLFCMREWEWAFAYVSMSICTFREGKHQSTTMIFFLLVCSLDKATLYLIYT